MNALTISSSRRNDRVVILTGLRYGAKSQTPSVREIIARAWRAARNVASSIRPKHLCLAGAAASIAGITLECVRFALATATDPISPMMAVWAVAGLATALAGATIEDKEGGEK